MTRLPLPEDHPVSPGERLRDAAGWTWAVAVTSVMALPVVWRRSTPAERLGWGMEVALIPVLAGVCLQPAVPWWAWFLVAFEVFALAGRVQSWLAASASLDRAMRLLESTPTGAPRVATVQCPHGDVYRWAYGAAGWEAIGPAPANTHG